MVCEAKVAREKGGAALGAAGEADGVTRWLGDALPLALDRIDRGV